MEIDNDKSNHNQIKQTVSLDSTTTTTTSNHDTNQTTSTTTMIDGLVNDQSNQLEIPLTRTRGQEPNEIIKPTPKRWLILLLFVLSSLISAFQWIYLASITEKLSDYYHVSSQAINFTSTIFMIAYLIFVIPATIVFERTGLRKALILGSWGTSFGAVIKIFACHRDRFSVLMLGQTLAAISQSLILSVPPQLASAWFPDDQVSLANGLGVLGNQLGIALGFIVPTWALQVVSLVMGKQDIAAIESGLWALYISLALVSVLISISITFAFDDCPKYAPGLARFRQLQNKDNTNNIYNDNSQPLTVKASQSEQNTLLTSNQLEQTMTIQPLMMETSSTIATIESQQQRSSDPSMTNLIAEYLRDRNLSLLGLSYGLNVGVFYAISTVLSQLLTQYHLPSETGPTLGLTMIISGMFGTVISCYILDKTHSYYMGNLSMYGLTMISTIMFALMLEANYYIGLYISILLLGFFMTGYVAIGYDIGNEMSWPRPETITAGLLNFTAQFFGVILTSMASWMVESMAPIWVNVLFTIILLIGLYLTFITKIISRRQNAINQI